MKSFLKPLIDFMKVLYNDNRKFIMKQTSAENLSEKSLDRRKFWILKRRIRNKMANVSIRTLACRVPEILNRFIKTNFRRN